MGGPRQDMQNEALVNTDTGHSLNRHLTICDGYSSSPWTSNTTKPYVGELSGAA